MLRRFRLEAAKWVQTIQISWSERMAYKLHFLLLILGPTLVFFFVRYNLWTSIYAMEGVHQISGYDLHEMLRYQVWVMIVSLLSQSYNSMNLSEDIRLGRISAYLIYPFEFWQFQLAGFLALQLLQLFVAAVMLGFADLFGWVTLGSGVTLLQGTLFSLLVSCFWFTITYSLGLLAFWLEETWVLRVMFVTISTFLSGAILPLEAYPRAFRTALAYTPFPYVTFVPTKLFMGEYSGSVIAAALTVLAWTGLGALLSGWIWRRGLRLYTAAGM